MCLLQKVLAATARPAIAEVAEFQVVSTIVEVIATAANEEVPLWETIFMLVIAILGEVD